MQLRTFTHIADFLEHVQGWLERYEIVNSLPLRICLSLKCFSERIVLAPYLAVVEEDDTPVITAVMAPYASLLLSYSLDPREEVLELIAHDLYEQGWQVSGVRGPEQLPGRFAHLWENLTGLQAREDQGGLLFSLSRVLPPEPGPGRLIQATESEIELVAHWFSEFMREANNKVEDTAEMTRVACSRVEEGEVYLWEMPDGRFVSLAARMPPLTHIISIAPVYTPPMFRGHGYASRCVAMLSQMLLEGGWCQCFLHIDASNLIASSIYQKIGFEPVCAYNGYVFMKN